MSGPRGAGRALLLELVRAQWGGTTLGVVLGGLWTLGKVTVPRLVSGGIDAAVAEEPVWSWTFAILVVGLASAVVSGGRKWFALGVARRVEAEVRERVFAKIQRLPFAYHDRMRRGASWPGLRRAAGPDALRLRPDDAVELPHGPVQYAGMLVLIDPFLTLVSVVGLPLVNVMGKGKALAERLHPAVTAIQVESAEVAAVVEESVAGVRVVKGFGAERMLEARLRVEADDVFDASMGATMVRASYMPAMELLPKVGLIAILAVGGHRVIGGQLTVGDARRLQRLRAHADLAAADARHDRRPGPAGDHVGPTDPRGGRRPRDRRPCVAAPLPATGGSVRVRRRHVRLPRRHARPRRLRPVVEPGKSIALVGATGSGKSTVAALLGRFYDVSGGRVVRRRRRRPPAAAARPAAGGRRRARRRSSSPTRSPATSPSPTPTPPSRSSGRPASLASTTSWCPCPTATGHRGGERGFSLSGGQRQRVAIARAILADPRVLVLDDATSAVDPSKEHEIRGALGARSGDRTTIVIAHRPATIALADRVRAPRRGRSPPPARTSRCSPRPPVPPGAGLRPGGSAGGPRRRDGVESRLMGWRASTPTTSWPPSGATVIRRALTDAPAVARRSWATLATIVVFTASVLAGPSLVRHGIDHGIAEGDAGALNVAVAGYVVAALVCSSPSASR